MKEGQPILKFDKAKIEAKGLNPVVVFVKTDEGNQTPVAFKTGINVKAGKDVIGEYYEIFRCRKIYTDPKKL